MTWLEKSRYVQKGIVPPGTSVRMQEFLKTNPTEEQLMILDGMDRVNMFLILIAVGLYFIGGLIAGYIIYHSIPQVLTKLAGV